MLSPQVSVVIPTRGRPDLLLRAVDSVLSQTLPDLEVLVVVDGPDEQTVAALAAVDDARLRVVVLPEGQGAPSARNAGIAQARGAWIALLDDDDEWLADKLATQLALAARAGVPLPIVTCRMVNRTPRADLVLPRRCPAAGEPISEYLAARRGLFHGDGMIQTSMIMAPTELFRRVPFTVGLRRLQEMDWTLRALAEPGTAVVMATQALVIWHTDEDRPRISFDAPWREQVAWLQANRSLFTAHAYAAVMMSVIAAMAAPTRDAAVFWSLLRDARRHGRPAVPDYVAYLQIWLVPPALRRRVRDLLLRRRQGGGTVPAPSSR